MNPALLYLIATLCTWTGWVLVLSGVASCFRLLFKSAGGHPESLRRGMLLNGGIGALLLLVALFLPKPLGREVEPGIHFPLVWVLMSWTGWGALVGLIFAVVRVIQSFTALNAMERSAKLQQAAGFAAAGAAFFYLYRRTGGTAEIFRGAMPLNPTTIAAILGLAVAALAAMAWAARSTSNRGFGKTIVSHAALLVGSIVFGVPFAWLMVTSFKEDKDIAQADALRWTPYVTVTEPYDDPENPLFRTVLDGKEVEGQILERPASGQARLDIYKPMSIRGTTVVVPESSLKRVPDNKPVVTGTYNAQKIRGLAIQELEDGSRKVLIQSPESLKGTIYTALAKDVEDVRKVGLRWQNYPDALDFLPPDTNRGLVYLKNTLILVILTVIGTVISCTMVGYAFSRLDFFGKNFLFTVLLSTMMLPGAVTMLPGFLIFRQLGWIDTLYPLWVPAFFAGAFNVFLIRQFFGTIPMELEDAAKIDGCSYPTTLWKIMVPQIKPALAAISIFTAMGAWNNFMGPLIYISSPEKMPIAYALQLYNSSRGGEPGLLMALTTMSILPVLLLFFFAQRYFIEGVTLSGLGGR